jgi:hypothetical protein
VTPNQVQHEGLRTLREDFKGSCVEGREGWHVELPLADEDKRGGHQLLKRLARHFCISQWACGDCRGSSTPHVVQYLVWGDFWRADKLSW